ncbi:hypothetical protein B1A_05095, partial [mine drainage metagenome]
PPVGEACKSRLENSCLRGIWNCRPRRLWWDPMLGRRRAFLANWGKGTVLMPTEGRGKPDGTAFISARGVSSTIRGLAIYYPEQLAGAAEPTPYPWTIQNILARLPGEPPLGGDGITG